MNLDLENAYNLILDKLSEWMRDFIVLLPNLVLATIILVAGFFIARWLRKVSSKLFARISAHPTLNDLLTSIVYVLFIGITLFTSLSILQLDKAVTSILAGAGILGLALAFAFQDIAANFMSGIFISFRRPIRIGDIVKLSDYMGKVQQINLRDTVLITFQGQTVIIPNKDVFQNPIENYSLQGRRRFDLEVGVSYGDDLEKVRRIALEAVSDMDSISPNDQTTFFYREFGGSSINFVLRMWCRSPEQTEYLKVGSEAIIRLKKAFDSNGISIPYPIRTLDFGIKGGKTLQEMPVTIKQMQ